ncbi:hypothetical protein WICPIJ_006723 [Wickerhamomyces pijperi]|uniref:Uncharacterized protein n=1 Tax=Wickerhamomyces pijperi TaxID=599730 RepID=A0A9P8TJY5_WICPI|nr:hypothetical protein WICPIJ_006723 [Wickerhamomyces pijperi]
MSFISNPSLVINGVLADLTQLIQDIKQRHKIPGNQIGCYDNVRVVHNGIENNTAKIQQRGNIDIAWIGSGEMSLIDHEERNHTVIFANATHLPKRRFIVLYGFEDEAEPFVASQVDEVVMKILLVVVHNQSQPEPEVHPDLDRFLAAYQACNLLDQIPHSGDPEIQWRGGARPNQNWKLDQLRRSWNRSLANLARDSSPAVASREISNCLAQLSICNTFNPPWNKDRKDAISCCAEFAMPFPAREMAGEFVGMLPGVQNSKVEGSPPQKVPNILFLGVVVRTSKGFIIGGVDCMSCVCFKMERLGVFTMGEVSSITKLSLKITFLFDG